MDAGKKYHVKRMLVAAGSAANGIKLMFEQAKDPILRTISQNPYAMQQIFDDLRGRLAEYYDDLTPDQIDEVIRFFSTDAGKAYNAATLKSAPHIESIMTGWMQDVLKLAKKPGQS